MMQLATLQRFCQWRTCHVQFPKHGDESCICMLSDCVARAACMWHYLQSFLFVWTVGLPKKHAQVQVNPTDKNTNVYTTDCHKFVHETLSFWNGHACDGWRWSLLRACKYSKIGSKYSYIFHVPLKGEKMSSYCTYVRKNAPCLLKSTISLWWRLHLIAGLGRAIKICAHTFVPHLPSEGC